ncbi:hypothetical protein E3N88_28077 [Mikania micrantha]|uniref:Uncharacterized protein n=1 Tax=Mikania micrantha TaxID=192012 RepID=A0A5N6MZH7_9ASTR|nr:hypothetical protein E3N88_28077 [Mikania micrantha]
MGTIVPGVQTGKQPTTTESQEPDQLSTGTLNPSANSHRAQILESGWWLVYKSMKIKRLGQAMMVGVEVEDDPPLSVTAPDPQWVRRISRSTKPPKK